MLPSPFVMKHPHCVHAIVRAISHLSIAKNEIRVSVCFNLKGFSMQIFLWQTLYTDILLHRDDKELLSSCYFVTYISVRLVM